MNYTLKGSISRTQPYQLDPTLTLEGAGAEAKATGEAINEVKVEVKNHASSTANPHNVTKNQLDLGEVDNTSDMDKPVSHAQETAIADAKKAGTDAWLFAEEVKTAAENAQTSADNAQTAADNAQTSADEAKTAAENAQATANSKTAWFSTNATLIWTEWFDTEYYLDVDGVVKNDNQPIFVSPTLESEVDYCRYDIRPVSQHDGYIKLSCKRKPPRDIQVKIVGFTLPE